MFRVSIRKTAENNNKTSKKHTQTQDFPLTRFSSRKYESISFNNQLISNYLCLYLRNMDVIVAGCIDSWFSCVFRVKEPTTRHEQHR